MPQIDTPLLLDILLGLVVLLFVPFGIRRGVAKEAMVSAGILLGATLAERFGETWGTELAGRFALDRGTAIFAASAITLFVCTFLLGYGGGAALGAARPGTLSRLTGGLLAAFNAALLLSYLLGWIESLLGQGAILEEGIVSEALLRRANLLLLAAAGVLLALTVIGWIVNANRARRQPRGGDGSLIGGIPPRQRPVRVPARGDVDVYEPGADLAPRSGRFGPGLDATSPLPPGGTRPGSAPWSGEPQAALSTNGHNHATADTVWSHGNGAIRGAADETVWAAWNAPANEQAREVGTTGQWPVTSAVGVTDDERCAVCRARVGPRDVFCPECGATL